MLTIEKNDAMRLIWSATLLLGLNVLATSPVIACRSPPEPAELRDAEADAIVLVRIQDVQRVGAAPGSWEGTASRQATIFGSVGSSDFKVVSAGSASCEPGMPAVGEAWILYLTKDAERFRVRTAWPFWWARGSMDTRLQRLNTILPLGIVREPTAEESRTLDAVERIMSEAMKGKDRAEIVRVPTEARDLSRFTRVYSRSSARWLSVEMFRSRTPQRLVSDVREQGPTEASCKCKLYHGVVELDEGDLRSWGRPTASRDD